MTDGSPTSTTHPISSHDETPDRPGTIQAGVQAASPLYNRVVRAPLRLRRKSPHHKKPPTVFATTAGLVIRETWYSFLIAAFQPPAYPCDGSLLGFGLRVAMRGDRQTEQESERSQASAQPKSRPQTHDDDSPRLTSNRARRRAAMRINGPTDSPSRRLASWIMAASSCVNVRMTRTSRRSPGAHRCRPPALRCAAWVNVAMVFAFLREIEIWESF